MRTSNTSISISTLCARSTNRATRSTTRSVNWNGAARCSNVSRRPRARCRSGCTPPSLQRRRPPSPIPPPCHAPRAEPRLPLALVHQCERRVVGEPFLFVYGDRNDALPAGRTHNEIVAVFVVVFFVFFFVVFC